MSARESLSKPSLSALTLTTHKNNDDKKYKAIFVIDLDWRTQMKKKRGKKKSMTKAIINGYIYVATLTRAQSREAGTCRRPRRQRRADTVRCGAGRASNYRGGVRLGDVGTVTWPPDSPVTVPVTRRPVPGDRECT